MNKRDLMSVRSRSGIWAGLVLIASVCGCQQQTVQLQEYTAAVQDDYVDQSIEDLQHLGWLGAVSQPLQQAIAIPDPHDPDSVVRPGGLVLRQVIADLPAAESGLQAGDVILRVGEQWLPIKDDATMDFLNDIESAVSSQLSAIEIGILRAGKYQTVSLPHKQTSIDEGLPYQVARIDSAAELAIKHIASQQNQDGSFGNSTLSTPDKIQLTSVAGLAMLAANSEDYQPQIDGCLEFLATEVDSLSTKASDPPQTIESQANAADASPPTSANVIRMTPAKIALDPLSTAYVLQFLAESEIQLVNQKWMNRILSMVSLLHSTQHTSGGWSVALVATDDEAQPEMELDHLAVHTTNQVLMSIGAWESKNMKGNPEQIAQACQFLKQQHKLRTLNEMDRRVKAALNAGTASGLVAINCQVSDAFLKQLKKDSMERVHDVFQAPQLAMSGLLSSALLARGGDKQSWVHFHNGFKVAGLANQQEDGSFYANLVSNGDESLLSVESDPLWSSCHMAMAFALQQGSLTRLSGVATSPVQVARNSDGKESSGGSQQAGSQPKEVGQVMTFFSMDDLSGEGSMEDQIKEKLKEMGLDADNLQFGSAPGGGEKPDDK